MIIKLRASPIQRPVASCWNRARSGLRGVRKSTSSMAAPMWRSFAARMRVWKRRVLRLAISRSTSRPSHSAWLNSALAIVARTDGATWLAVLCLQVDEGLGHAVELHLAELVQGGVRQHRLSFQW